MAFVPEAALIALREGLEAFLITGILLGLVTRLGRPDARKHVWMGFGAATAASLALGLLVQRYLLAPFEEGGGAEWFELGAAAVAVVILSYMIVWMWGHTRSLLTNVREKVDSALGRGALLSIVALTFASVIREGVEVVLFYGALWNRASPADLAWSGLAGFALSALLVLALLKGVSRINLQAFFGATGLLLVFVAAGLLVHGVGAAMEVDLLPPAPAVWDTSGLLPDDSAPGRVLHALVGYASTPTLLQATLYFVYVLGFGGWYLWSLGLFHKRTESGRRLRQGRATAGAFVVVLVTYALGMGAAHPGALVTGHGHGPDEAHDVSLAGLPEGAKVGVLLRSHGEPVHYNETTYRSFADFVRNLFVTLGMENLLLVDQGTVLLNKAHPFEKGLRLDAQLMDAWTRAHPGPAVYVGSPFPRVEETRIPFLDGFHLAPGGPGLGEPDILEVAGLSAYVQWLQMDNESPMHATKGLVLDAAEALLRQQYGDRVVVARSHHMRPHVGPDETDADAAALFVREKVDLVVDAYTSSVHSDIMNTCMMRPHLEHALQEAGYTGRLVHAAPSGPTHAYAHAVADEVARRLAELPPEVPVAVFLTHHGADPASRNPCASGPDQYHAHAKALHEAVLAALAETAARPNVTYLQVYGAGAGAPDDGILSPQEALEAAHEAGAEHVLDLPYELTGNGFDNLVAQRASYGLDPAQGPHYDRGYETRLTWKGMDVRILSASFGTTQRAGALVDVIHAALAEAYGTGSEEPHRH